MSTHKLLFLLGLDLWTTQLGISPFIPLYIILFYLFHFNKGFLLSCCIIIIGFIHNRRNCIVRTLKQIFFTSTVLIIKILSLISTAQYGTSYLFILYVVISFIHLEVNISPYIVKTFYIMQNSMFYTTGREQANMIAYCVRIW